VVSFTPLPLPLDQNTTTSFTQRKIAGNHLNHSVVEIGSLLQDEFHVHIVAWHTPPALNFTEKLSCNESRRAEHCWDGFQSCGREILQCLGHSYTSRVKALKHMDKETPRQKKPLCADHSKEYGLQYH